MSDLICKVAIVGGTHGNELTGIYLIKKFARLPELVKRASFECEILLANPRAIAANRRYIDRDLNRCFASDDLANHHLTGYENNLAKQIVARLGTKDRPQTDLIIDLHSTTSNMGLTLLLPDYQPFTLRLAAHLAQIYPDVRICLAANNEVGNSRLRSLAPLNLGIEVGAIAQGVLDARLFHQTQMLVTATLDYIDAIDRGERPVVPASVTVYQSIGSIDYPRDPAGELLATIHPDRQFQDYQPLHSGDPLFLTFDGEAIPYTGTATVWPIFINEAAYYEQEIAMTLTDRQEIGIESR
jgi:succinylglutamate desuccinylase